jgi:hypothetical protein
MLKIPESLKLQANIYMNITLCLTQLGRLDDAVQSLAMSLGAGYDDLANVQENPMLRPLQTLESYFTVICGHLAKLEKDDSESKGETEPDKKQLVNNDNSATTEEKKKPAVSIGSYDYAQKSDHPQYDSLAVRSCAMLCFSQYNTVSYRSR